MSIIYLFVVLKAISEDSPTVPTLLTDYILKGMPEFNFIGFYLRMRILITFSFRKKSINVHCQFTMLEIFTYT